MHRVAIVLGILSLNFSGVWAADSSSTSSAPVGVPSDELGGDFDIHFRNNGRVDVTDGILELGISSFFDGSVTGSDELSGAGIELKLSRKFFINKDYCNQNPNIEGYRHRRDCGGYGDEGDEEWFGFSFEPGLSLKLQKLKSEGKELENYSVEVPLFSAFRFLEVNERKVYGDGRQDANNTFEIAFVRTSLFKEKNEVLGLEREGIRVKAVEVSGHGGFTVQKTNVDLCYSTHVGMISGSQTYIGSQDRVEADDSNYTFGFSGCAGVSVKPVGYLTLNVEYEENGITTKKDVNLTLAKVLDSSIQFKIGSQSEDVSLRDSISRTDFSEQMESQYIGIYSKF